MAGRSTTRGSFGWRQVRVLGMVVGALFLLGYGVYRVGKIFDIFADRYEVYTLVPTGLGLREGAPVTLAGQRVGQVTEIRFIPVGAKADGNNLRIRLALNADVVSQVRRDSRAFLRTQGLLGDKFVDIAPGSEASPALQPGDTLIAGESLDLDQFLERAAGLMDEAGAVVTDVRTLTAGLVAGQGTLGQLVSDDELYGRLVVTTAQLEETLAMVNDADGTFGRFLRDPAVYDEIHSAVARVDSIGALILYGSGTLSQLLQSDSLYQGLMATALRADSALGGLNAFVGGLTEGQGTLQRILTDPALYDELLKAVIDAQTLIQGIRDDPSAFKPEIRVRIGW